jgi:hypothetical protein
MNSFAFQTIIIRNYLPPNPQRAGLIGSKNHEVVQHE